MTVRVFLIVLVTFLAMPAWGHSTDALSKGEIFVWTEPVAGFDFPRLLVSAVVDSPPDKVYEVVTNCDKFPDRLPQIKEATTLKRSATSHTCSVTVGLPFPLSNLTAVTVDQRQQGPDVWFRKWTLVKDVESSYEHLAGSFVLKPFNGDPNRTLVAYRVHAVPKTNVPDFLRKTAQKKSMPKMIERIREEANKL